ncbi:hypothetical protein IAR50_000617 [Cryptococcus sp. DSM 104548]
MTNTIGFFDLVKNIRSVDNPPFEDITFAMASYSLGDLGETALQFHLNQAFTPGILNRELNLLAIANPNRKMQVAKTGEEIKRSDTHARPAGALFAPMQYNPPCPHLEFPIGECLDLVNVKTLSLDG